MSINKGFSGKWVGLEDEKNLINQQYPNQVRNMDTYFAEDSKIYYIRWNETWFPINDFNDFNSFQKLSGSSGTSGTSGKDGIQGLSGSSGTSFKLITEEKNIELNIDNSQTKDIELQLNNYVNIEYIRIFCKNSFPEYPIYKIDIKNKCFILEGNKKNDYKKGNKIIIKTKENSFIYRIFNSEENEGNTFIYTEEDIKIDTIGILDHVYIISLFDISLINNNQLLFYSKDNILFNTKILKNANINDNYIEVNDYNTKNYNQSENSYGLIYIENEWYNVFGGEKSILNINNLIKNKEIGSSVKMVYEIKNIGLINAKDFKIKILNKSGIKRDFECFYKITKI